MIKNLAKRAFLAPTRGHWKKKTKRQLGRNATPRREDNTGEKCDQTALARAQLRKQWSRYQISDTRYTRYLTEVRYLLSILCRPFDFSIPCCYSLFYTRITTKAHAYKFLTPRGKILIFPFTISIETYIKQVNETKESVYIRKELNSHRIGLMLQHGKRKCLHKKRVELSQDWFGTPTCKRKCLHKKRVEPPQDWFGTQT